MSDIIAHNNEPGRESFRLAQPAHLATEIWNESVPVWNRHPARAGRTRGRCRPHATARCALTIEAVARAATAKPD